jgi:hypothetical protein
VVAARQHRGPTADAEMRSPSRHTCVAGHAVQVHWWTANGSLKNEPRRRGAPPTGFRTSVRMSGDGVAEAQFLLC